MDRIAMTERDAALPEEAFRVEDGVAQDVETVTRELESFLDPDVIPDWLHTEQHALGGRTPMQALRDGHLAEVLQLANATEHDPYI
ncbi:antitoxin Xre/MbcA/ParS toxin-binding domain-containing protein [Longimicrobium sp.]|uniref:antitoxin Xre/MbcA/ParS toxin-binding domain-containing protein n=1 Tax=Longimicrobium sp. TaxID=2029185 RepID=UPI003B3A4543